MHFVAVKSEHALGAAVVFRIRELLIRQKTHSKNALGGHSAQFDEAVPQWAANAPRLIVLIGDPATTLPEMPRDILRVLVMTLCQLNLQISALDAEIKHHAHENATARRLRGKCQPKNPLAFEASTQVAKVGVA
jgi:transposase